MNKPLSNAELNEIVAGLKKMSRNLWWSWNQEAQDFFCELSPRGWQNMFHNAVAVLHEVSEQELRARLQDAAFAGRARELPAGIRPVSERPENLVPMPTQPGCTKTPSLIFPPSSVSTNRCRLPPAASASSPATTPNPPATSASALSASACSTAKVISSRRLTPTTGRRNITIRWTRITSRSNRCWMPTANVSFAAWKSA